ncbi:MAG: tetratricopeptide repeat protein [Trueperaceae bacterium]
MNDTAPAADWRLALQAGRFDEAHRHFLLSGEEDAEVLQALAALSDIQEFAREKSWGRARRKLDRLGEPPPLLDWSELRLELARLEESSRHLENVEPAEALERLASGEGRWLLAEAANQRGTAQVYLGDAQEARRQFGIAVGLDPRHYRALTNLGNACLEAGEVDEAIDCYQRALSINDEFANAHHNLGVAYRRQGKVGRSVRELRRAQRVQQRTERERARDQVGQGAGKAGLKALRWTFIGIIALVLFVILRDQGFI